MKTLWGTPTLRAKTSTGKDKLWRGVVLTDGTRYYRSSEAWMVNAAGTESQRLVSEPALVEAKNVGRANETSPYDQAVLEVHAKMAQKIDKGYAEIGKEAEAGNGFVLPMLAHTWAKKKHLIEFPVLAQPKFDGTRLLYNSAIGHWSRQGKEYLPEVVAHIAFDTDGLTLDGELILPDGYSFQDTVRAIKKYRPGISELLRFRVYDIVDAEQTTAERMAALEPVALRWAAEGQPVVPTPTITIASEAQLQAQHAEFLAQGFEGTIVRTRDSRYTPGHRSAGLLKLKDFDDAEFMVIGFTDGLGKDAGTVVFRCAAGEHTFQVRPDGTVEERREMFANGASYIGRPLTVRYQGLSEDGIPRFPVGVGVRELD